MNAEISETIRARLLRFGVQIPELLTQRKFVSAMPLLRFGVQIPELLTQRKFVSVECHDHFNAHKPPKPVTPTVFMLDTKF